MPLADVSGLSFCWSLASSLGPGPSSHQPFSAQLTSHRLFWASSCSSVACLGPFSLGPASLGPAPACTRPLQAQPPPLSGPSRPSSWHHHDLCSGQLQPLWWPVLTGPNPGLPMAVSSQAGAFWRPSCAQHWPSAILSGPRTSLGRPLGDQLFLTVVSTGLPSGLTSRQPLWTWLLLSFWHPL